MTTGVTGATTYTTGATGLATGVTSTTEKIQPQPYPLPGQALPTGWGNYPQGAYYPPPVQKPQTIPHETAAPVTTTTRTEYIEVDTVVPS